MSRALASTSLNFLVLGLLVAAAALFWAREQYTNPGPLETAICLDVPSGSTFQSVSDRLEEQGAISNGTIFRVGADYADRADQLKAGSFLIDAGMSMSDIVNKITATGRSTCGTEVNYRIGVLSTEIQIRELDPSTQSYEPVGEFDPREEAAPEAYTFAETAAGTRFRITVAEGATSWQIIEGLKAAPFLAGEIEAVPAEGILAPTSYEVVRGSERAALVTEMQEQQAETLARLWEERAEDLPLETPEEALILASIIEKETAQADERPLVSSVFVNRLNQGIPLQTDPTVIYGITLGQGALGRGIRQSELRRETPYNTYLIRGLPPGPIANPGAAAIEAALNPATTDLLFFVADGTGGHAFAETLAEHNANVRVWRQIEAERANQ